MNTKTQWDARRRNHTSLNTQHDARHGAEVEAEEHSGSNSVEGRATAVTQLRRRPAHTRGSRSRDLGQRKISVHYPSNHTRHSVPPLMTSTLGATARTQNTSSRSHPRQVDVAHRSHGARKAPPGLQSQHQLGPKRMKIPWHGLRLRRQTNSSLNLWKENPFTDWRLRARKRSGRPALRESQTCHRCTSPTTMPNPAQDPKYN